MTSTLALIPTSTTFDYDSNYLWLTIICRGRSEYCWIILATKCLFVSFSVFYTAYRGEEKRELRVKRLKSYKQEITLKRTSPALTVPTAGDTVRGASAGTINSNDVGPTSTMGPEPILGTGWVNSFALVCELMTSMWAAHVSETAVAFILITEWESSSGGRTPTALQWSLNSRPMPVLQVRSNSYSYKREKRTVPTP